MSDIIYAPQVVVGLGGKLCVTFVQQTGPNIANTLGPANDLLSLQLLQTYGLCPTAVVPPTLAANPAVLATQFWETIPLPVPRPTIPPGYAITGKPAYLVTGGTVAPPAWADPTPLGPLTVTAAGSYTVTWGDGATSGPFPTEGLAYPHGTIAHTYDTTGHVTVTITEQWTATWALGAARGTLQQLQTTAALPAFPVQQVQAVITS